MKYRSFWIFILLGFLPFAGCGSGSGSEGNFADSSSLSPNLPVDGDLDYGGLPSPNVYFLKGNSDFLPIACDASMLDHVVQKLPAGFREIDFESVDLTQCEVVPLHSVVEQTCVFQLYEDDDRDADSAGELVKINCHGRYTPGTSPQ